MTMTLDSLLADLESQAGLSKQAADSSEKKEEKEDEKKEEKKEEGSEGKAKSEISAAKDKLDAAEKDVEKAEQTKEASVAGAALANEIMQKLASATQPTGNKESEMNKQASVAGKALADALLEKLASAGDQSTVNGTPEGVAPNKTQIDVAQQVAEQDATIKPMPTGNGIENSGTINQIFDAIVADALGQGAATPSEIAHVASSAAEGAAKQQATPNQVQTESVEKTAAVMSLVNSGIDFDSAVDMVKAAAAELVKEEEVQVKQAAFEQLIASGVDFDLAAALVKSAGLPAVIPAKAGLGVKALSAVKNNAKTIAGTAGGYVAGRAVSELGREKKAAVNALCEAGVDFDQAIELVQAKAQELYGA